MISPFPPWYSPVYRYTKRYEHGQIMAIVSANRIKRTASPRTEAATVALRRLAGEQGADTRLPSFIEMRETLGVSVVTLNKALAILENQRVLYRRHGVGIFVSPHRLRCHISVVVSPRLAVSTPGDLAEESPVWGVLMESLKRLICDAGHDLSVQVLASESSDAEPVYADFDRAVRESRVHGVLGIGMSARSERYFAENDVPMVTFAGFGKHRIELNNHELIANAARALLRHGCRKIALVLPGIHNGIDAAFRAGNGSAPIRSRHVDTFADALRPFDAPLLPRFVQDGAFLSNAGFAPTALWYLGYRVGQVFFANTADRPDGVVCSNDVVASGLLTAAQEAGVQIGTETRFATHANSSLSTLTPWAGRFIRLEVSPGEIASRMIAKLDRLLAGTPDPTPREWYSATVHDPNPPQTAEGNPT